MALQDIDVSVTSPDIDAYFNLMEDYASSAISSANQAANSLLGFSPTQYTPNVTFESINTNIAQNTATRPNFPSLSVSTRNSPSAPSLTYPTIAIGNAPTFTEADPSINLPSVPSPLDIEAPVKDFDINIDYDYPIAPDTTLPDVPTMEALNIPTALSLNIPEFSLEFPTSNGIVIPGITFSFTEERYDSPLLSSVKDELLARLSGGTGLNPIVEEALWNRGRDRESRASILAEQSLLSDAVSRGFSRPAGSIQSALDQIIQETQSKIIDLSREIMIKQAELEQENIKTSIQQVISLEDILIREHQQVIQRSFEVAKYVQDLAIELFKVQVTLYTTEVEAYRAFAAAYETKVRAELAKIEIFKAQLEAEKLKGEINEQNIRIYLARIDGVKQNVEIYKALISAVSERLRSEELKLQVYKTDIEAYSETVKSKAIEFNMYSEQIKGEMAKVEIFDSKVKAFTSRVQAYASQAGVSMKKADTEVALEDLKIKKYSADIDAFIKQVQADQLVHQSAVDVYKGQAQIYMSDITANSAVAELALKQAENTIAQNKYKADAGIQNAQITLESIKSAYQALLQAKTNAGSIFQSIGTSALGAINVSAAVQGQVGIHASENHNYNTSL